MKKINKILIVSFILLIFINIFCSGSVYAAINKGYSSESSPTFNSHIEIILSDNIIVKALEHFIYWITNALETLIKNIFGSLTGAYVFPWADGTIFNAVAFLDVNFINPAMGSLFLNSSGEPTAIGSIFKNLYYTIFVLAVGFFTVCVGVMALRLIFSSIASEKAKYKKATLDCFVSLLILFATQYLISFIFFVNESLVTAASSMLSSKIQEFTFESETESAIEARQEILENGDRVLGKNNPTLIKDTLTTEANNFYGSSTSKTSEVGKIAAYSRLTETTISDLARTLSSNKYYKYAMLIITGKFQNVDLTGDPLWQEYRDKEMLTSGVINGVGYYGIYSMDRGCVTDDLCGVNGKNSTAHTYYRFINLISDIKFTAESGGLETKIIKSSYTNYNDEDSDQHLFIQNCKRFVVNPKSAERGNEYSKDAVELFKTRMSPDRLAEFLKKVHDSLEDVEYEDVPNLTSENVFSGLGDFFKQSAYDSSKKKDKYNFVACIVYAIFLVQSVMYFIAYFKRFFYILMLAMFAPIVIVYDFLTKSLI